MSATHNWLMSVRCRQAAKFGYTRNGWSESVVTTNFLLRIASKLSSRMICNTRLAPTATPSRCTTTVIRRYPYRRYPIAARCTASRIAISASSGSACCSCGRNWLGSLVPTDTSLLHSVRLATASGRGFRRRCPPAIAVSAMACFHYSPQGTSEKIDLQCLPPAQLLQLPNPPLQLEYFLLTGILVVRLSRVVLLQLLLPL